MPPNEKTTQAGSYSDRFALVLRLPLRALNLARANSWRYLPLIYERPRADTDGMNLKIPDRLAVIILVALVLGVAAAYFVHTQGVSQQRRIDNAITAMDQATSAQQVQDAYNSVAP